MKHLKKFKINEARKVTKKQNELFTKKVEEILEPYQPEDKSDFDMKTVKINTKVGKLLIIRYDDNQGSEVYSIFMRFEEPERAKIIIDDCNPYSGKWNIHTSDFESAISLFEKRLKKVTT